MSTDDARPMDRLERALQASLRPVDPGADFTTALQARLATAVLRPEAPVSRPAPVRAPWLYSATVALAASIVVALAVGWQMQELHSHEQVEQARLHSQLLLALEITSERLGHVQQRIEQYQTQEKSL